LDTNLFVGMNNGVFRSTNGGATWSPTGLTNTIIGPLIFFPKKGGGMDLFAGTNGSGVLLSTNDGANWTPANTGLPYPGEVLTFAVSGSYLFAGTNAAGVYLSTDSGESWNPVNTGLTPQWISSFAIFDSMLFAGTVGGGVWYRPISEMLPHPAMLLSQTSLKFGLVHVDSTEKAALSVTNNSPLLLIIDSLSTGTNRFHVVSAHDTVTENDTISLSISFTPDTSRSYSDTLYVFSNAANRLTKVPLSGNGALTGVSGNPGGPTIFALSQNYPNPFNPATTISYDVPKSGIVALKVYDVLGREVALLVNEQKQPGSYRVKFDGSSLSSGVYFYRLQAGSFVDTKKLVLLK